MKKEWLFMVLWFAVSSFMVQNFWKTDVPKPLPTTSKQIQGTNSEQQMEQQGLVDIKSIDPTIKVALMYSRTDNFCHKQLYKSLRKAYMLPQCAAALKKSTSRIETNQTRFKPHHFRCNTSNERTANYVECCKEYQP